MPTRVPAPAAPATVAAATTRRCGPYMTAPSLRPGAPRRDVRSDGVDWTNRAYLAVARKLRRLRPRHGSGLEFLIDDSCVRTQSRGHPSPAPGPDARPCCRAWPRSSVPFTTPNHRARDRLRRSHSRHRARRRPRNRHPWRRQRDARRGNLRSRRREGHRGPPLLLGPEPATRDHRHGGGPVRPAGRWSARRSHQAPLARLRSRIGRPPGSVRSWVATPAVEKDQWAPHTRLRRPAPPRGAGGPVRLGPRRPRGCPPRRRIAAVVTRRRRRPDPAEPFPGHAAGGRSWPTQRSSPGRATRPTRRSGRDR
jgi:hypothetical protein